MHLQEILQLDDTIVSRVTCGGEGSVSIIRASGKQAHHIVKLCLASGSSLPKPGTFALRRLELIDHIIDEALILTFKSPRSLTGEDVVEIHIHANPFLVEKVVSSLISLGARQAKRGEFLHRAYTNGKYTLNEIEAISGVFSARNEHTLRLNTSNVQSRFSKELSSLREQIVTLWMQTEAFFDFSEEEDVENTLNFNFDKELSELLNKFIQIEQVAQGSIYLNQGNEICLLGSPNVGKSSLLNVLSCDDTAIVSDKAGTTRDSLSTEIYIDGHLIRLIDTAGLRQTQCDIESMGIARSKYHAQKAQCVLYIQSIEPGPDTEQQEFLHSLECPIISVVNKCDLLCDQQMPTITSPLKNAKQVFISVKERIGLEQLKSEIISNLGLAHIDDLPYAFNKRQLSNFHVALKALRTSWDQRCHLEVAVVSLRKASDALGELLGEITNDDMLGQIFSNFCIGK